MRDEDKTKRQLMGELADLRKRLRDGSQGRKSEGSAQGDGTALEESEDKFRSLAERSLVGIYLIQDGVFKYVNPRMAGIFGYAADELIDKRGPMDLTIPEDRDLVEENVRKRVAGETQSVHYKFRGRTKKDEVVFVEVHGSATVYQGRPAVIGSLLDITERMKTEQALRESEEKYRLVIENANEGILVAQDGIIRFHNPKLLEILGYEPADFSSRPFTEFIHPDDRALVLERHRKRLRGELNSSHTYQFRALTRDGRTKWVELRGAVTTWEGRPATLNFITDITERKKLEEEMQKSQKLESLGILAGGIAHDFNNMLTAIVGQIAVARLKLRSDDPLVKRLEEAEKVALHATTLTNRLLTFARGGTPVKKTLAVERLIRESAGLVLSGSNVTCEVNAAADLRAIEGDEGQMHQALNNLIINAVQAMPQGGTVRITAENETVAPDQPLAPGEYVKISIADQGTGILPEHLPKIFDPYFTTKPTGTGLGLSVAYSVVKNHGGRITAESEGGTGTIFTIHLPASPYQPASEATQDEAQVAGSGRVLLMDDEEMIRDSTGEMLKEMGYEVSFVKDGAEAISLYEQGRAAQRPFDAVIMDLTIPGGMGGKEAMARLRALDPGVKAIVSSGYSNDPIMANFREYGFRDVIVKPYKSTELSRKLHRVIQGR